MKNIISDWLEKHGNPEITEQVRKEAELLNKQHEMKTGTEMVAHAINNTIKNAKEELGMETDLISDGWHSFGDLYKFRLAYNALAFNALHKMDARTTHYIGPDLEVHKSWKHHDGEYCFGEERKWFIVAAKLPTGVITNHYKAEHWDLFQIPETEKSIFPFDGHTAHDALDRIFQFLKLK